MLTRRECLIGTGLTAAGLAIGGKTRELLADAVASGLKVGMCDWSLKRRDPSVFELAKQIGLDGVQVSIGSVEDNLQLRQTKVQKAYVEAARKTGLKIPSLAMGLLNDVPLMSEPRAALWVADAIKVTHTLGVRPLLLAFFGKGELKQENKTDMQRVIDVLVELAPRAEDAGVILGLESYLSAEANLRILDAVKSEAVQVYYDFYNSGVRKKHDVFKEIKQLGRERICEVHFKEGSSRLGQSAVMDWKKVVSTLKEIGYSGWIVLETSCPNDIVKDTQANLAYTRKLLASRS